jgi:hypothetical protein
MFNWGIQTRIGHLGTYGTTHYAYHSDRDPLYSAADHGRNYDPLLSVPRQ